VVRWIGPEAKVPPEIVPLLGPSVGDRGPLTPSSL